MKKADKYLLIAPHSDDELNILGTTAEYFKKNKCEMHLLLVTNSDFIPDLTEKRYHETLAVTNKIGFSKSLF